MALWMMRRCSILVLCLSIRCFHAIHSTCPDIVSHIKSHIKSHIMSHMWTRHIAHVNEPCCSYEWNMSHMTCQGMSHMLITHLAYTNVTRVNQSWFHTCERGISHLMAYIWCYEAPSRHAYAFHIRVTNSYPHTKLVTSDVCNIIHMMYVVCLFTWSFTDIGWYSYTYSLELHIWCDILLSLTSSKTHQSAISNMWIHHTRHKWIMWHA